VIFSQLSVYVEMATNSEAVSRRSQVLTLTYRLHVFLQRYLVFTFIRFSVWWSVFDVCFGWFISMGLSFSGSLLSV